MQHGTKVHTVRTDGTGLAVDTDRGSHTGDIVLVVTGVRPDVDLAATAGAELGARGAIGVDRHMQTSLPDVFAAGDCVHTYHRLLGQDVYLPLGSTAHKQGRVAGINALGGDAVFAGSLGTQAVKVFDLVAAGTGLRDAAARRAGFDPFTVATTRPTTPARHPSTCASPAIAARGGCSARSCSAPEVREFGEGSGDPLGRGGVACEFVVAASQVLHEGVPGDHDPHCAIGLQSAHRS